MGGGEPLNGVRHLLVILERHTSHLSELDGQLGMSMFRIAKRLEAALRSPGPLRYRRERRWAPRGLRHAGRYLED